MPDYSLASEAGYSQRQVGDKSIIGGMMKAIYCTLVAAAICTGALTPQVLAAASIMPGTEVELMVLTEVNTRISEPGSVVRLRLNKPVILEGKIALPVGTPAFGKVESLLKSGIAGSRGTISVRMTHLETAGGRIPLAEDLLVYEARGGKGDDAAKLLLAPFYAPFSPANSAKLKAGELVHARIASPQ